MWPFHQNDRFRGFTLRIQYRDCAEEAEVYSLRSTYQLCAANVELIVEQLLLIYLSGRRCLAA
jgi:hypothetical protein